MATEPVEESFVLEKQTWEEVLAKQEAELMKRERELQRRQEALEGDERVSTSSNKGSKRWSINTGNGSAAEVNKWVEQQQTGDEGEYHFHLLRLTSLIMITCHPSSVIRHPSSVIRHPCFSL